MVCVSWSLEMSVNTETGVFLSPENSCGAGAGGGAWCGEGAADA